MSRDLIAAVRLAVFIATVLTTPFAAYAQAPSPPPVTTGQRIWVTLASGTEISGTVDRVTPIALMLITNNGTRTLDLADLRKIEKPDSVKNGTLTGGVIGVVWGGLGDGFKAGNRTNFAELVAACAAVGTLIDKAIDGRDLVWERAAPVSLHVAPVATLHTVGFRGLVRW